MCLLTSEPCVTPARYKLPHGRDKMETRLILQILGFFFEGKGLSAPLKKKKKTHTILDSMLERLRVRACKGKKSDRKWRKLPQSTCPLATHYTNVHHGEGWGVVCMYSQMIPVRFRWGKQSHNWQYSNTEYKHSNFPLLIHWNETISGQFSFHPII